ncbi:MAG: peptide chain release factor N(5)-glutamine methyltransferase [Erythrobacter sp.]|nr:peptide chain release factor N(5)-glutamine methyltransferase [Erythrobacter sp.]
MTVGEAIRAAAQRLAATSDTARLDAELLMAHAFEVSRSDLLLRYMGHTAPKRFFESIERRAMHEPVAYIIGTQEFYGRNFRVTADTLIPRADSETIIQAALEVKPDAERVLDLGTGSGALLLTFLAETQIAGARSQATGVGIDKSVAAIGVADENASGLGLNHRVRLWTADWAKPGWTRRLGTFDLILCNPPYVEADAALDAQVRDYEPASALFAGPEGLDDYRALIPQLVKLLVPGGVAIFEIGHTQAEAVSAIAAAAGFTATLRHDLAGRPRCLILQ